MSQQSVSVQSHSLATPLGLRWQGASFKWKILSSLAALLLLSGAIILGVLYPLVSRSFYGELEKRAALLATNLSDGATGNMITGNSLELHALTTKYARIDGVAYAYLKTAKGEVVVHSLGTFPTELEDPDAPGSRLPARRLIQWRGRPVLEIQMPVLEGQVGSAHIGVWEDGIRTQVKAAAIPLVGSIIAVLFLGFVGAFILVPKLLKPLYGLREAADRISRGELDIPVQLQSRDEIADIASSLERMRASLKAAMSRLKPN